MSTSPSNCLTRSHGFLDLLPFTPTRGHRPGSCRLQPEDLARFNAARRAPSRASPSPTPGRVATAGQRAPNRQRDGHEELAEYEDFCRFRQIAAECAGIPIDRTGPGRRQWRQALARAQDSARRGLDLSRARLAPDPPVTTCHVA